MGGFLVFTATWTDKKSTLESAAMQIKFASKLAILEPLFYVFETQQYFRKKGPKAHLIASGPV